MPVLAERLPLELVEALNPSPEQLQRLTEWLYVEVEDAISARWQQEQLWRDLLKKYEGVPGKPARNVPVENAPNIEVTLGAIASDSVYAQVVDLVYSVSPVITIRAVSAPVEGAKALQRFVDWGITNEWGLRSASEHSYLDDVQLGTGIFYAPWVERRKKTRTHRILSAGPRIFSIPLEDLVVPGGAYDDLQYMPWVGYRVWLSRAQLEERAALRGWDLEKATQAGNVDWVRSRRESLSRTSNAAKRIGDLYEIFDVYALFDLDGDGFAEDLLITYDRTAKAILAVDYAPFDWRPFEAMRYQLRAHLFYGIGVMEMVRPYQEEETEIHNSRILNMLLSNARLWLGREGVFSETEKIWPGKVKIVGDPERDLKVWPMADVFPSAALAETVAITLGERRVGVNSQVPQLQSMGSRTPGITALSLLQQMNRRFTPAFDGMRLGTAGIVKQCLYRYQERLLTGDPSVEAKIESVLGAADGQLVIELLKDQAFDEAVRVELTTSSASVNREQDRQDAIVLNNLLSTYYQRMLELAMIIANPQVPANVKEVAGQIAERAGEIVDRTLRTFDSVRDPQTFLLDPGQGFEAQGGLDGIAQLLSLFAGGEGGGNVAGVPGSAASGGGGLPGIPGQAPG